MRITTAILTIALASSGAAQTVVPVGPFRSVELSHGGHVILRHGPVQRVTILTGDAQSTGVRVEKQRLIDNCKPACPRGYRLQIEVVTPEISAVAVSNGGTLQSAGAFPAQASIDAAVEQGGRIDIRSIPAGTVNASVYSGGGIFTTPRQSLTAAIESGGAVKYWGNVRVKQSVRDGGVVERGTAEDFDEPLSGLSPPLAPIAPIAPVPPIPPHRHR